MLESNKDFVVLKNVSKRYGNLLALDDISFRIGKGENFGYIGPNGAGKTTTIKIIVGLLTDFQGSVEIGGHSLPSGRGEAHKLIGYLPQRVSFQEWRTVSHALKTFGKLSGMDYDEIERRMPEVLDLVDLSGVQHRKIEELSGGTIQRLGLAQALIHDPKFLVLDEPLSGLDPTSRYQVKETIKDLAKGGTTVFFSSHILSDVQDVATKIGILDLGKIIDVGTLEELKSKFPKSNQIEIILSKDSGEWNQLELLSGVERIEQPVPDKLLVSLYEDADFDETSHELIKGLIERNSRIRSFNPVSPSLDELYMRYIGEEENI